MNKRGKFSKETVVLRRWGALQDNLVLPTELATVKIRSNGGLTLETSAFESL